MISLFTNNKPSLGEDALYKTNWAASMAMLMAFLAPLLPVVLLKSMAPIFIVSAILMCLLFLLENKTFKFPFNKRYGLFFIVFLAFCALSSLWSIHPVATIDKFWKMLLFFVPLIGLFSVVTHFTDQQYCRIMKYMTIGLVCGVSLYIFEANTGFKVFWSIYDGEYKPGDSIQNRSLFLFYLFMGPAVFYCWLRQDHKLYILAGLFLLVSIHILIWISSTAAMQWITILMAIGVIASFLIAARFLKILVFLAMVATILTAPIVVQKIWKIDGLLESTISNSLKSRLEIWDFTARSIADQPILGAGLKSSAHMPHKGEVSVVYEEPRRITHLHPHNGVLQIWYEFGFVGICILIGFIAILLRSISRLEHEVMRRWAFISFALAFLYCLPSFGMWQTRFMAMLAMFAVFVVCVNYVFNARHRQGVIPYYTAS